MPYFFAYNKKLKTFARKNRKPLTTAEHKLWQLLRRRQLLGFKFLRQKPLANFIADFYCSKLRLVIEVDGGYHKNQLIYDQWRSKVLNEKFGITVLRFTNNDVLDQVEQVEHAIVTWVLQTHPRHLLLSKGRNTWSRE
ncbi:MAG: endonuclease domain-containing protein [Candidatus Abawacabacteria bacterium]|nr:endonuclease domain-containing protein [Candidatus Abawacabacteria bacterium]